MGYNKIQENLIVGSQPESDDDIQRLKDEGVKVILNLQTDDDINNSKFLVESRKGKWEGLGIRYERVPIRDFNPKSVRKNLPRAVAALAWGISEGEMVYVHCNAGMGRSPAVAIAYLYWFCDDPKLNTPFKLNDAYTFFTDTRNCGPDKEAIRGATYDLANTDPNKQKFEDLCRDAFTDISKEERESIQKLVRSLR